MRAGDVVQIDFGTPIGSEAGFVRPAVILTATAVLSRRPRVVQVVPITSNTHRAMATEVALEGRFPTRRSVAQVHLLTTVSIERLTGEELGSLAAAELAQIRQVVCDLIDIW